MFEPTLLLVTLEVLYLLHRNASGSRVNASRSGD